MQRTMTHNQLALKRARFAYFQIDLKVSYVWKNYLDLDPLAKKKFEDPPRISLRAVS